MKYFRAFRLVGNKAMDEYSKLTAEMNIYQNEIIKQRKENPDKDLSDIHEKIDKVHEEMQQKYGMVPHLHYHALPEKGFVSELLNEATYEAMVDIGKIKEGQARKLELAKETGTEIGYSVPVIKIDEPEAVQQFNALLTKWQKLKSQLASLEDNSPQKPTLEEQYEAFKTEMQDKYKMNPDRQYVFETTELGIYAGISEEHLSKVAEWQKEQREAIIAENSGES